MVDRIEADEVRAHNVELLRRGADPLTIPIDGLNFSVRLRNTLCENEDLYSLGEVLTRNRAELLRTRNFGRKSLRELEEFLESVGLSLLGAKREAVSRQRTLERTT
jgi:DNA-directed RNA polymerase subunit alpha